MNKNNTLLNYSAQIKALSGRYKSKYIIEYQFYNAEELVFEFDLKISSDDYSDILEGRKFTDHFEMENFSLEECCCNGDYRFGIWSKK